MDYGAPPYRQRYGSRIDYYTPHSYAGPPVGCAHPMDRPGPAVGQGYGAPMTTYGNAAIVPYGGLFDRDRDYDNRPFWQTLGDTALVGILAAGGLMLAPVLLPAAAVAAPVAVLVGGAAAGGAAGLATVARRKRATHGAEEAQGRLTLARKRKEGWREVATSSPVGAGMIGTAAATAPVQALTLTPTTTDPAAMAAYSEAPSQTGLYAVAAVLGIGMLGVIGWMLKGSTRRVS